MGPLRRARRVISIHAPRVGSDTTAYVIGGYPAKFQSTLPAWGATSIVPSARSTLHFNPRSPRGERLTLPSSCSSSKGFQSTLPAWGATPDGRHTRRDRRISIHAPRVGSDREEIRRYRPDEISIHAPRVGSDREVDEPFVAELISIHAPRVGSDAGRWLMVWRVPISIHAPRVGSDKRLCTRCGTPLISIHAPRVGSDAIRSKADVHRHISIHAPRVGSDYDVHRTAQYRGKFQSTLPAWGATRADVRPAPKSKISIHAPRVGSDLALNLGVVLGTISIHAPRVGSDVLVAAGRAGLADFNPRSPRGERLSQQLANAAASSFQSTLPAWGATLDYAAQFYFYKFQSTLPAWGATALKA